MVKVAILADYASHTRLEKALNLCLEAIDKEGFVVRDIKYHVENGAHTYYTAFVEYEVLTKEK